MKAKTLIAVGLGAVALAVVYVFTRQSRALQTTTGGYPINALPARQYALAPVNLNGAPPSATFAPFSGVPFVEAALRGINAPTTPSPSDSSGANIWSPALGGIPGASDPYAYAGGLS